MAFRPRTVGSHSPHRGSGSEYTLSLPYSFCAFRSQSQSAIGKKNDVTSSVIQDKPPSRWVQLRSHSVTTWMTSDVSAPHRTHVLPPGNWPVARRCSIALSGLMLYGGSPA